MLNEQDSNSTTSVIDRTDELRVAAVLVEHYPSLLGNALRLTRREADAWDLLQDTVERALTNRSFAVLPTANARRWLLVVMRNLHADRCRSRRRHPSVVWSDDYEIARVEDDVSPVLDWRSIDPDQVRACLALVNPRFREAYQLQEEQGMSLAAIAARLCVPVATAGTRIFRARRQLRELLTRNGLTEPVSLPASIGSCDGGGVPCRA